MESWIKLRTLYAHCGSATVHSMTAPQAPGWWGSAPKSWWYLKALGFYSISGQKGISQQRRMHFWRKPEYITEGSNRISEAEAAYKCLQRCLRNGSMKSRLVNGNVAVSRIFEGASRSGVALCTASCPLRLRRWVCHRTYKYIFLTAQKNTCQQGMHTRQLINWPNGYKLDINIRRGAQAIPLQVDAVYHKATYRWPVFLLCRNATAERGCSITVRVVALLKGSAHWLRCEA